MHLVIEGTWGVWLLGDHRYSACTRFWLMLIKNLISSFNLVSILQDLVQGRSATQGGRGGIIISVASNNEILIFIQNYYELWCQNFLHRNSVKFIDEYFEFCEAVKWSNSGSGGCASPWKSHFSPQKKLSKITLSRYKRHVVPRLVSHVTK